MCVSREAGKCPSGAAPPLVQSSLALLQIQPDQLQDRPIALCDHRTLRWKLDLRPPLHEHQGHPAAEGGWVEGLVSPPVNVTSS